VKYMLDFESPYKACSVFTRVTACTLALSPIRDTLIEGFSHFVTSMTASIASGWSVYRVGFAPLESAAFARRTPTTDITKQGLTSRKSRERMGRGHR
jgi:hypothetical protein